MDIFNLHSWDISPTEAVALQKELASRVTSQPLPAECNLIAACDVSFDVGGEILFAAIVVLNRKDFSVVEEVTVQDRMTFPYVPGLLSFRELPVLLQGFAQLEVKPDLVLCDGQGIAHPRRLGIASHLGLWLGIPTIGSAKNLLCGTYNEPDMDKGSKTPIIHRKEIIGYALRSRSKVKPIFVSPGHLCDLASAVDMVNSLIDRYRIPVPIRHVHNLSNAVRKEGHLVTTFHSQPVSPQDPETLNP
ncbi:MAG TPA: deoxyribonuclease V [Oligoflexus sp.]|uniref:deoxyribonuclease V n=1 Tax=Oligoflexus sp. TaxID=1971216 RepID=UPI002D3F6783|nr:deoxyribonuclease V [Oligoflexus sp.]HYX38418.1 deoxyribonuclease V [Oligoflexus sp.]